MSYKTHQMFLPDKEEDGAKIKSSQSQSQLLLLKGGGSLEAMKWGSGLLRNPGVS